MQAYEGRHGNPCERSAAGESSPRDMRHCPLTDFTFDISRGFF